jgi:hypothetical protein
MRILKSNFRILNSVSPPKYDPASRLSRNFRTDTLMGRSTLSLSRCIKDERLERLERMELAAVFKRFERSEAVERLEPSETVE